MQSNDHFFPPNIHGEDLTVIQGVHFTPREIDAISCFIKVRGTSKISSLLSISPNTVIAHSRNIMLKLGCNSREGIIDFIEQSQTLPLIRMRYGNLVTYAAFEKCLKDISKVKKKTKQAYLILYGEKPPDKPILSEHLGNHLKQAGININIEEAENKTIDKLKSGKTVVLLLGEGDREKIPKELHVFDFIDASDHQAYYFLVFGDMAIVIFR